MAVVTYRQYTIEDTFERRNIYNRVLNETPQNYTTYSASFSGTGGQPRPLSYGDYIWNPVNQTFTLKDIPNLYGYSSASRTYGVRMETSPYYCKIEQLSVDNTTGFQMISGVEYIREITLLDVSVSAEEGTYPINGAHTDGYWYRINTPFDLGLPNTTTYERRDVFPQLWRYIIRWSFSFYYFDGVPVGIQDGDLLEFSYRLSPTDPFTVGEVRQAGSQFYSIDVSNKVNYIEFRFRYYSDERGYSNPFYVPLDAFGAIFPTIKTKINGAERKIVQAHAKINGVLKPITKMYIKVGGQLKEL